MKNFFTIVLGILFLIACGKEKVGTREQYLTDTDCWRVTQIAFYDSTVGNWDDFFLDECLTENCWRFHAGGTVTWDNGATKCDASEPDIASGTWSLTGDGTVISIEFPGYGMETSEITEISPTRMVILQVVDSFGEYNKRREVYESN